MKIGTPRAEGPSEPAAPGPGLRVLTGSAYALARTVHRWRLRLALVFVMLVAWDPIQHTLAVLLP